MSADQPRSEPAETKCNPATFHGDKALSTDLEAMRSRTATVLAVGGALFVVGLFIPLVLIIAVPVTIFALAFMLVRLVRPIPPALKGVWQGPCPYCDMEVWARQDMTGLDCPHCRRRILRRDDRFCRVPP